MTGLIAMLTIIHAVGVAVAYCIWKELENIRRTLDRLGRPPAVTQIKTTVSSHFGPGMPPIFAIWINKGRCWELDLNSVPPGYAAGNPPSFQGSFEGQRVKKECFPC